MPQLDEAEIGFHVLLGLDDDDTHEVTETCGETEPTEPIGDAKALVKNGSAKTVLVCKVVAIVRRSVSVQEYK